MSSTLFIINDAPYGNERAYNALRLAGALSGKEGEQVRVFLMADAVGCAKAGQKVPEGYYSIQIMLGKVLRKGEVGLCGTCMDARGMAEAEFIEGAKRGTMAQLAEWTMQADKVLVFEPGHGTRESRRLHDMIPELGVIEGYFGDPWAHAERKHVVAAVEASSAIPSSTTRRRRMPSCDAGGASAIRMPHWPSSRSLPRTAAASACGSVSA